MMSPEPGFYLDISNEEYHAGPGLSKTDMSRLLRSPAHYKAPPNEETSAMIQGEAFHLLTLQQELFDKQFAVMPQGQNRAKKEGKEFASNAEAQGKKVIPFEVYNNIKGMKDAIWAHPTLAEILKTGVSEVSGYWRDQGYPDILLKIRPDWLCTTDFIVLDLKSTTDARLNAFRRIAYDKDYHIQAAHYLTGCTMITGHRHTEFYFAAVERDPPYGVVLYRADEEMIRKGQADVQEALRVYEECMKADTWPCYPTNTASLGLPGWVKRQEVSFG
jgi:hypothetical protein